MKSADVADNIGANKITPLIVHLAIQIYLAVPYLIYL